MKCFQCGGELKKTVSDMPFKIDDKKIIIIKNLPILQCENCREFLIEDPTMEYVENIILKMDKTAELEVIYFAV